MRTTTLPVFTGLRGLAALIVLFFHLRTPVGIELTFGMADPFSMFGWMGVDMFFVLSGFILSHVYSDQFSDTLSRADLRSFAVSRFSRIYPLHFVTTFLMLLAYATAVSVGTAPTETGGYNPSSVILSLLLVQEWFGVTAPNPGSWSISIELINYIVFPIVIFMTARLPKYWPVPAILFGALIANLNVNTNITHGVAEFIMGCAAYSAAKHVNIKVPLPLSGVFYVLPFLIAYSKGATGFGIPAICFAAAIFFLAVSGPYDPFARLCASRPLVFLGEISYSVYLLQWFVWIGWKHVIARLPVFSGHPYLMISCAAASLIVVSIGSYYAFEKPARSLLRRRLDPFASQAPQSVAARANSASI